MKAESELKSIDNLIGSLKKHIGELEKRKAYLLQKQALVEDHSKHPFFPTERPVVPHFFHPAKES